MARQRIRGEGSISHTSTYKGDKEKWIARVWNPKTQRYIHRYVDTERQALKKIKQIQWEQEQGLDSAKVSTLMKNYLPEWLALHRNNLKLSSYDGYEAMVRVHLIPRLGRYKLTALTPEIISRTWDSMIKKGHSATVVNHCQRRLSRALTDAVKRSLISRNPCRFVTPPKIEKKEILPLDDGEIQTLLEAAKGTEFHPIIFTALHTGMRRNELLGLQCKDIDLDLATIYLNRSIYRSNRETVIQTTKTTGSRRAIALSPEAVLFLRSEEGRQIANGIFYGYAVDGDSPVFPNSRTGKSLLPDTVTHEFAKIARGLGFSNKFHDLRHTHATMLLKRGINPKIVQERLGHASIRITMDIYSHVMPNMQKDAMADFTMPVTPVK